MTKDKISFILLIIGLCCCLVSPKAFGQEQPNALCYYLPADQAGGWDLPKANCEYFAAICDSNGWPVEERSINDFSIDEASLYDIVYISGYGDATGFISNEHEGHGAYEHIPWKTLAQINTQVLLVDACYSGMIFDYPYSAGTVITSAYKSPSWNIMVPGDNGSDNVSSFVVMLRCMFDPNYECPEPIPECGKGSFTPSDPEGCQFNLVLDYLFRRPIGKIILPLEEQYTVSTAYINGKPWRR